MKFDEHEFFLNHINNLLGRRQMVTATYLSVNTLLIGALAFLFKDGQLPNLASHLAALALLFSGVVVCNLWRRLIMQHSTLIGWWYGQLRLLEANIPESKRWITKEYKELYEEGKGKPMIGLTRYETQLTWLFTAIYLVFCLVLLGMLFIYLIR